MQVLWTSLEFVLTGGDIVKQMPQEAMKFVDIDKQWLKIMEKEMEDCKINNLGLKFLCFSSVLPKFLFSYGFS